MASEIDIVNLALANLGDSATVSSISPPEGSVQAEHCARFYPIARDAILEMGWNFNTLTTPLNLLAIALPNAWEFAYAVPDDCLKIFAIYDKEATDEEIECGMAVPAPFVVAIDPVTSSKVIYTDLENAVIRYARSVSDTAVFPATLVIAMSHLLSSFLAGPIYKGIEGMKLSKEQLQMHAAMLAVARENDANQRKIRPVHVPEHLAFRG